MKLKRKPVAVSIINDIELEKLPTKKLQEAVEVALDVKHIGNAKMNVIIVSDEAITQINNEFLQHDYPTDVLSFDLTEGKFLEGEIYISAETAKRQAEEYKVPLKEELVRLAIHGTLHLVGFEDDTDEKKKVMTQIENECIPKVIKRK